MEKPDHGGYFGANFIGSIQTGDVSPSSQGQAWMDWEHWYK